MATNNTETEKGNEMDENITVGTIFTATWGATMTLVDFYQVVGVTKSGKSVKVREIAKQRVTDNFIGGDYKVVPIPGEFKGEVSTRRLQVSGYDGSTFFNPGRSRYSAKVWNGTSQTVNTWD